MLDENEKKNVCSENLLDFYEYLFRLKKLSRRGWLLRGIEVSNCESVAEHMYSMTWLALYFIKEFPELDENKVLKMCLVHDLGESIIGDITPVDDVSSEKKYKMEYEAINTIFDYNKKKQNILLNDSVSDKNNRYYDNKNWIDLWNEFESKTTPESIFVNDIDKLDLLLQAVKYKDELGKSATEFIQSALISIKNEKLLNISKNIAERYL